MVINNVQTATETLLSDYPLLSHWLNDDDEIEVSSKGVYIHTGVGHVSKTDNGIKIVSVQNGTPYNARGIPQSSPLFPTAYSLELQRLAMIKDILMTA